MRSLLLIAFIFGFLTGLAISSVLSVSDARAQSEHLDDPVNYQALELTLEGCKNNLPLYFHACITGKAPFDTDQLGTHVYACNKEAWQRFFNCTGLYPKQTLAEQIENGLGCAVD